VSQEFLDGALVSSVSEEVGGVGVAEAVGVDGGIAVDSDGLARLKSKGSGHLSRINDICGRSFESLRA